MQFNKELFGVPFTPKIKREGIIDLNYYNNCVSLDDFMNIIVPKYNISVTNKFDLKMLFDLDDNDDKLFFTQLDRIMNVVL